MTPSRICCQFLDIKDNRYIGSKKRKFGVEILLKIYEKKNRNVVIQNTYQCECEYKNSNYFLLFKYSED